MKLAMLLGVLLVTTACQHGMSRQDCKMDSWRGSDISEVVSDWGVPSGKSEAGASTVYEWNWTGSTRIHKTYGGGYAAQTNSCREWFDVNSDGIITGWHYLGQCSSSARCKDGYGKACDSNDECRSGLVCKTLLNGKGRLCVKP